MTAQATPFRTAPVDQPLPTAPSLLSGDAVTMVVVGSALAVVMAVTVRLPVPGTWIQFVLAAAVMLAGVAMWRATSRLSADQSAAWRPISLAVIAAAIGQLLWVLVGAFVTWSIRAPAATDVFAVAFYALMSLGLLRMPFVRSTRIGTFRMAMDVVVGMVAAATVLWEVQPAVFDDGPTAPLLQLVLIGSMLLALLRRSPYGFDTRLALLLAALVPTVLVGELGAHGSRASTLLWAVSAMFLGVLAARLAVPMPRKGLILAGPGRHRLIVPYLPVAGVGILFSLRVVSGTEMTGGILPWGMLVVMLGVVARSWAAVRENRQLIALERDQLLAALSHDIRTPLTVVSGFADVLAGSWESLPETERREMVTMMRGSAASLVSIVGDMQALARSELDGVPLHFERLDARQVISDAIRQVFVLDGSPPIRAEADPDLDLIGDHGRLVQVLAALFENALRYGNGRILVVAGRTEYGRVIEVHDDGAGVAHRYEKVIWERFERGAHELNANVPGSGLGLAIVRSVVRAHGGDATYRLSERLGGACFVLEFPFDTSQIGS